jgi:hypothetical protein
VRVECVSKNEVKVVARWNDMVDTIFTNLGIKMIWCILEHKEL